MILMTTWCDGTARSSLWYHPPLWLLVFNLAVIFFVSLLYRRVKSRFHFLYLILDTDLFLFDYSTLTKDIRITTWCLHFIWHCSLEVGGGVWNSAWSTGRPAREQDCIKAFCVLYVQRRIGRALSNSYQYNGIVQDAINLVVDLNFHTYRVRYQHWNMKLPMTLPLPSILKAYRGFDPPHSSSSGRKNGHAYP